MNPRLQKLFDKLEDDRIQLFKEVEKLSAEQFQKSIDGKWSVQQIMSHLYIAEKLSHQYMAKKVLGIKEAERSGLVEELKMIVLQLSQRLPFKFKVPHGLNELTPTGLSFEQLRELWETERGELKIFLEKFEPEYLDKKIYRHVRAGLLNIQHALIFFREHYIHHLLQIKRLMR